MKFKWYHVIIILMLLLLIGYMSFVMTGFIRKGETSRTAKTEQSKTSEKTMEEKIHENSTRSRLNASDKSSQGKRINTGSAESKTDQVPAEADTGTKNMNPDDKTEINDVADDIRVKALVVDKETKSAKRMVKYLKKAGFETTLIGSLSDFNVEDYDTLVIPGGHNITPSKYGAERQKETYGTDEEVDDLQIAAVRRFKNAKKPVLGVCRGCQVVNVALKGTINQHIPGWHKKNRNVIIDRKSWLYPRLGKVESVFHYHHQCVDKLGEGLIATQWDEKDHHIEAIEHETLPIYGIQWHPDRMGDQGVDIFRYYKELVLKYKKQNAKDGS